MAVSKRMVTKAVAILALATVELALFSDLFSVLIAGPVKSRMRGLARHGRVLRRLVASAWTSNIPGNPYAMDWLSTMLAGPFPSLVDYNACMPNLELPVVLCGRPPAGARYWSIQVFLNKAAGVLNGRNGGASDKDEDDAARRNQTIKDVEMKVDDDGFFRCAIGDFEEGVCSNVISTKSKKGLLVMRCFKMKEGTSWLAPSLYDSVSDVGVDGKDRPVLYQDRKAGPFATIEGPTSPLRRLTPLIFANAGAGLLSPPLAPTLALSALLARLMHGSISSLFARKYSRLKSPPSGVSGVNSEVTRVAGLGGNADHVYWTFCYDARERDVEVVGVLEAAVGDGEEAFRYVNLQCYRWDSIPIPSFLDSDSLTPVQGDGDCAGGEGVAVVKRFRAVLTCRPTYEAGRNEIDVGCQPSGTATFRLLLPANERVVEVCEPKVSAI
mmetsp:Transcript_6275/g.11921  ORF Transcript_6275/g.11921 Transcript_6275/m.11921 type:complete len:440 (+) Transcript_6275:14-1333(+)